MAAFQRQNTRPAAGSATATASQAQQFTMPTMDDKLIIYGDGLIYGGASYPASFDHMPVQATPVGGQRNHTYTGLPNTQIPRVNGSSSRLPGMQQQQQQQLLQQKVSQSHDMSRSPQFQGYMNQRQPYQQQQQQQLQSPPLQQQSLLQQQQHQQQQRQQQLQQAYSHWPFGGMAQAAPVNNNMGMFSGHANQTPSPQMGYGQPSNWPGYTAMSPSNPNMPYTFGM